MSDETTEVTPEKLQELYDGFSPELKDFLSERIDKAALNWLCVYGIPKEPVEVQTLVTVIYRGVASLLLHEGFTTLTDKGEASEEDAAKVKAEREERLKEVKSRPYFTAADINQQFKLGGAGGYL